MKYSIGLFAAFLAAGAAFAQEETPAEPTLRTSPAYPAACRQALGENAPPQHVSVMFDVSKDGETENVRVREIPHDCFTDSVIAAVRDWVYEPRRVDDRRATEEDLEVTFTFVLEEPTQAEEFDVKPLLRQPPVYPVGCMRKADELERVLVEFDVDVDGETENISVVDTTNSCLNNSAVVSIEEWKYRPKIFEGKAVPRENVQTIITYHLSDERRGSRPGVAKKLMRAQKRVAKDKDAGAAFAILDEVEERFGENFSVEELSAFHQVRGMALLQTGDYAGALDDFRIVKRLGVNDTDTSQVINEMILKLEAELGIASALLGPDQQPESGGEETEGAPPSE